MRIPGLQLGAQVTDLAWRPTDVPGVSVVVLHANEECEDERARRRREGRRTVGGTILVRMQPGCGYAPHRHLSCEDVLVLAGGYRDETGTYRTGEHVHYELLSTHAPVALGDSGQPTTDANPTCILYSSVPGGIELLAD